MKDDTVACRWAQLHFSFVNTCNLTVSDKHAVLFYEGRKITPQKTQLSNQDHLKEIV